ncbi:MAG: helicase [Opitutae bacterium]
MTYQEFIKSKRIVDSPTGINAPQSLNSTLFDFQRDIVGWSLRRGRAAIFADCGMGKTLMQLEWADKIPGRVLIVAPLAVAGQTVREASKFGIDGVKYVREDDPQIRIPVTNYEMLHQFDPENFRGVVLDESSILKSYTGKFRNQLIQDWGGLDFRLAATATPAPNDFMELGSHAEFLGVMTRTDMLSTFFVHDGGETQKWRLKGHAEAEFWKWLCEWAVMIRKPCDLGYDNGNFILPPLNIEQLVADCNPAETGLLFPMEAKTLAERRDARKSSIKERVEIVAGLVNGNDAPWLVWCDLNTESDALTKAIPGSVEVKGSDAIAVKEQRLHDFTEGRIRVMVTKPSIAGWGLNWQHCANMAFTGLSDSYEQFYQAVRRCWRFGQIKHVNAYVVTSNTEGAVVKNIERKERDSERMAEMMVEHMADINSANIRGTTRTDKSYKPQTKINIPAFLTL